MDKAEVSMCRGVEEMMATCSTEDSSSHEGSVEENFFEESKNGDMSQWKDLWTAMVLLVAMVSFFLLIVGLMFRLVGQDLAMDPRYVNLGEAFVNEDCSLLSTNPLHCRNFATGLNMQYVIDTLYNVEVTSVLDEHMSLLCARLGEAHNISVKIESGLHIKSVIIGCGPRGSSNACF